MSNPVATAHHRGRLIVLATFPGLVGLVVIVLVAARFMNAESSLYPPPHSNLASSTRQRFPLAISPDPISLGTLDPRQSAAAKLTLRNSGSHPVIVASVETSCPCLKVAEQSTNIGPGQSADLTVKFDPTDDPDFRGGLSIDVIGRDPPGGIVFRTRAQIEVRVRPAEPADRLPAGPVSDL